MHSVPTPLGGDIERADSLELGRVVPEIDLDFLKGFHEVQGGADGIAAPDVGHGHAVDRVMDLAAAAPRYRHGPVHAAGDTGSENQKSIHAARRHGQRLQLLEVAHVAQFGGLGLDGDAGAAAHSDLRYLAGNLQFDIETHILIGGQLDSLVAIFRKSSGCYFEGINAGEQIVDFIAAGVIGGESALLVGAGINHRYLRPGNHRQRRVGHGSDNRGENTLCGQRSISRKKYSSQGQ